MSMFRIVSHDMLSTRLFNLQRPAITDWYNPQFILIQGKLFLTFLSRICPLMLETLRDLKLRSETLRIGKYCCIGSAASRRRAWTAGL